MIQIQRNNNSTIVLPLESAIYTDVLMGEHSLVFTISSAIELDIQIGDNCVFKGHLMTINQEPEVTRTHQLDYVIRFEGQRHTLSRFIIKDEGALTFDYMGDLSDYMFMFLESINASDAGWIIGELEDVEPFALTFDQVDHLSALYMIAEGAGCEVLFENKTITIKKTVGIAHNYPLAYGKDNGLYSIRRVSLENSKIVTRAYAVGGSQNLPASYAFKKLTLTGYLDDPATQAIYGVREGVIEDLEIYPQRTSAATAVGQINEGTFTLSDITIDFDLNGQRIEGAEAYIVFKSGMLNGQQFKILGFNNDSKTIRYEANKDSNGGLIPFGSIMAEIGDKYTLVGIRMPESYVTAALSKLADKRQEYLNSNKVPRVVYDVAIDPLDLKRKQMNIRPGDVLPFMDAKIGLDDDLRVTSVRYSASFPEVLFNGMTYEIEVGNEVSYNRIQKVEKDIKETKEVVTQVSKTSIENDRRNIQALNEFKGLVFDPDGNLENPLIQAIAGLFGTNSMYYDLESISLNVNANNDPNAISLTAGKLIHKRYKIDGLGYIWNLMAFNIEGLIPTQSYYLAAKCSKTTLQGEWVLTTDQQSVEADSQYWYFNLGILSSVIEGKRSFRPTKMFTMISGGDIETDTITAYFINVVKLFAQEITATRLKVTGDSRIAGFSIDGEKITSADTSRGREVIVTTPSGVFAQAGTYSNYMELLQNGLYYNELYEGYGEKFWYNNRIDLRLGANGAMISITGVNESNNPLGKGSHPFKGLHLRLPNAIDFTGSIIAGGERGYTGQVAFRDASNVVKQMNYYSGIMIGISDS